MSDTDTTGSTPDAPVRDEARESVIESLRSHLGDALLETHIAPGRDMWARVANESWVEAGRIVRYDLDCRLFGFLSVIDWLPSPFGRYLETEPETLAKYRDAVAHPPTTFTTGVAGGERRFQVFARVTNLRGGWGITLKSDTSSDDDPHIGSWVPVYGGADWHEREAWEMYGVTFDGHPGLRHMYLPGSFEGYPLRKDFPLLARLVKPWPGIVDVEPMPAAPDDPGTGEGGTGEAAS